MSAQGSRSDRSTTGSQIASALAGGVVGLAVGLVVAQLFGGFGGLLARAKRLAQEEFGVELGFEPGADGLDGLDDDDDHDDDDDDDDDDDGDDYDDGVGGEWWDDEALADEPGNELGDRVLEAFRNDPTLAERPIDIDVHSDATIELSGRVDTNGEIDHAAAVASGVPGVLRVVSQLIAKQPD